MTKALDEVKYRIPIQVLQETFRPNYGSWRPMAPVSMDSEILSKVIKPRVVLDTNIVGGQITLIPLDGLNPEYIDRYSLLYHIPPERLNNRSIMSVLSVGLAPYGIGNNGFPAINNECSSDVLGVAARVGNSFSSVPIMSNATAELVERSTVVIRDSSHPNYYYVLRCVVGNEQNMENINPRSWHVFCKLCELAVKAYIYNTMLIRIDQAFLSGGQELGAFKNYVDGLADSEEMYQTQLREVWQAVNFMNSATNYSRFIRLQISPGI
jgi:hypothetical protein